MRFAIYYTPGPADPLTLTAASWLGRNPFAGTETECGHRFGHLVRPPRRYGFHGTLKAPFRLAPDVTATQLRDAFDRFAAKFAPFDLTGLKVGQLGRFFALVPTVRCKSLDGLAAQVVRVFEPFRADLTAEDIARRQRGKLTDQQRANLEQWGYPYVFDTFDFHMTLTGPVDDDDAPAVAAELKTVFANYCGKPHRIGSLALFVEPGPELPFQVDRFALLSGREAVA